MVNLKLVFLAIMVVLAVVIFVTPMFFRETKGKDNARSFRIMVRIRVGCFLAILILLLLCVIL